MYPSLGERLVGAAGITLVVLLAGCTSPTHSSSQASPAHPSPRTPDLAQALSRLAMAPCALLSDEELAAYGVTHTPREIDLSEGPAYSCYWLVSTGIQIGWIPYPREEARKSKAKEPGTREVDISGYSAVQTVDKESCYQYIKVSSDTSYNSFSTFVGRYEPDAPKDTCGIATAFSKLIIDKLKRFDTSDASDPSA